MTSRTLLFFIFVTFKLTIFAQNSETMVAIPFNANENTTFGIPIEHNYQGIVIPVLIDTTYKITYRDSSEIDVAKNGNQISFVFKKQKTVLIGQFMVSPCALSEFEIQLDLELMEYVVSKIDYFTAYRVGNWELTIGSEARKWTASPVRFVEPCK